MRFFVDKSAGGGARERTRVKQKLTAFSSSLGLTYPSSMIYFVQKLWQKSSIAKKERLGQSRFKATHDKKSPKDFGLSGITARLMESFIG